MDTIPHDGGVSPSVLLIRFAARGEGSVTLVRAIARFVPFAERPIRLTTSTMAVDSEVVAKYISNHSCAAGNKYRSHYHGEVRFIHMFSKDNDIAASIAE